jgi:predicted dehydrogenase
MAKPIRFGILGTGFIARQFAGDLRYVEGAELRAVGSRSQESADALGDAFDIPNRHGTYDALAADPDVDVVYVATPHPFHCPNTLMCLDAGKAVLCEKPFALNEAQALEMIDAARRAKLFLMEGMWTYCFPTVRELMGQIQSGDIGEPRMMTGAFCFRNEWDPSTAVLNRELGGGALLDVGVYPISMAHLVFGGEPESIVSTAHIGETGVDEQNGIVLNFPEGGIAAITSAVRTRMPEEIVIGGTDGMIRIPEPFYRPAEYSVIPNDSTEIYQLKLEYPGMGMQFEAQEVVDCLRAGKLESGLVSHASTLAVMRTLDRIRAQWDLRYPGE